MTLNSLKSKFTTEWQQTDWGRTLLLVLLVLAVASALWQWLMPEIRTVTDTRFRVVPQLKEVVKIKRVQIPCPEQGLVVLEKRAVAKKLDISWMETQYLDDSTATPEEVITPSAEGTPQQPDAPNDIQVLATADLPKSAAGTEAVAVINMQSGETTIIAKERPLPWFAFENHAQVGLWYGINQHLMPTGDLEGRWQFLQIKRTHLGLRGSAGSDGTARLQAGIVYEW